MDGALIMTTASKYRLGAAALAFAGAAAMTPVIAQADIAMPQAPSLTSVSKALGSAAGQEVCDVTAGLDCVTALAAASNPVTTGYDGPFKNNIIWSCFDCQNSNFFAGQYINISTFSPFNWTETLLPEFWNWWSSQSSQTCFLGWSTTLGAPYAEPGQFRTDFSSKGCNGGN